MLRSGGRRNENRHKSWTPAFEEGNNRCSQIHVLKQTYLNTPY